MNLKNKKVLVVTTTDNMITQFLLPHIKYMQEQGAIVECACNKSGFWFDELQKKHGLVVHKIDFTRYPFTLQNLVARKELFNLCKKNKYDLIHCHQAVGAVMGRMVAKKFGIPCLFVAHGFFFFKGCPKKYDIIYKNIERHYAKYTDALCAINQEDFEVAKTFKAKKVYKINGIGVDVDLYSRNYPVDRDAFRTELGLQKNDFVVAVVGEHIKRKNYDTILKIIKNSPNAKFVICGTGKLEQKHKNMAQKAGVLNRTLFLGYRHDINKIMRISDCFLSASVQEGLPLSIAEAMSVGLPVVCSRIRGHVDLVDEGKGGYLISKFDVSSFVKAIEILRLDEEKRKVFGDYNQEKIKQYDTAVVLNQLKQVYEEL